MSYAAPVQERQSCKILTVVMLVNLTQCTCGVTNVQLYVNMVLQIGNSKTKISTSIPVRTRVYTF